MSKLEDRVLNNSAAAFQEIVKAINKTFTNNPSNHANLTEPAKKQTKIIQIGSKIYVC